MKKAFLFWALLIFVTGLIIDTGLYLGLSAINQTRNLFYDRTQVSAERIAFWLENSYDSLLGWNLPKAERNNLGTRREQDYAAKPVYKIKTFGDSFTYGAEVSAEQTFQAFIENKTGWDCLNYGVGAFGPDQALLKYQNNLIKTEYTVLGILCENIGRVASIYPAFYMREWAPPKPRFITHGDSIAVIANPIPHPDLAYQLLEPDFVEHLKSLDYWPEYYEKKLGVPAKLRWPATRTVLGHFSFFRERVGIELDRRFSPSFEVESKTYKYCHLYEQPNEILRVLEYLIDRFVAWSQLQNEQPIILIFPDQFSLDLMRKYGRLPYQPLVNFLEKRGYTHLDLGNRFASHDYGEYYNFYNSHFSPRGNERVAEELIALIKRLDEARERLSLQNVHKLTQVAGAMRP